MRHLLQDLRFGLRTFVKAPGFTLVAIAVLALGIGANTAIFTIVNQLLFAPLSPSEREWVGVYSHDRTRPDTYRGFSYPNYVDIRDRSGVFERVMAHDLAMVGVPAGDTTRRTFVSLVSSNYFETLGVSLAAGRPFTAAEERPGADVPVVIVSHQYWRKAGLDPGVLGRTLRINARDFTIVGVAPEGFTGTMALVAPEMFLPLGVSDTVVTDAFKRSERTLGDRADTRLILAGRLKAGLGDALVKGRLDAFSRQLEEAYPAENKDQVLTVSPLPRLTTSTSPQTDVGLHAFTALLMSLSGVVLLIACLNLANMLLARGAARRKEVAVRLALGASRPRIVTQLLTEGLALAVAGGSLGLLLSYWATQALAASMVAAMPLEVSFDPLPDVRVLAVTAGFAMLSTIAFGLGPALKLSRRDLVTDLKDLGEDRSPARRWFAARNLMVVGQVALSLALLVAAGIFAREALAAASSDPGYRYGQLALASLDPSLAGATDAQGREKYRAVLERIRAIPGVTAAGLSSTVPFGDMHEGAEVERVGVRTSEEAGRARTFRVVGAGYFAALGQPMVRGREFTAAEEQSADAPSVCVIDEAMARRLFGAEDPIGQTIRIRRDTTDPKVAPLAPMQIVGIAPPIREELLDRAPTTHVYVPFGRHYRAAMHVHVRHAPSLATASLLDAVRREIRTVDPAMPVLALTPMQSFHDRSLELWALNAGGQLFSTLGLLALTLAVVGVYGVKSYVVSQRTREIGIRMAMGATHGDVLRMLLRDGLTLTGAGLAVGVPLAALVSTAFSKVFVGLGGTDLLVMGIATAVLAAAAVAAAAVPAWRATRIQPLAALRSE
jgi:predicted permease